MTRLFLCLSLAATPAFAQEETDALCSLKAEGELIRIAVCAEDPGDEGLAAEGERLCDGNRSCGVWFYTDAEAAPETAPAQHNDLTPAQITSALGVYDAVDKLLVRISRDD